MIRFLLNDQPVSLDNAEPGLTVLQYLRTNLGLTGTKEGCAAGDCGACTVVLGAVESGRVRYNAINSCITPVGALHGKQLLTIFICKCRDINRFIFCICRHQWQCSNHRKCQ